MGENQAVRVVLPDSSLVVRTWWWYFLKLYGTDLGLSCDSLIVLNLKVKVLLAGLIRVGRYRGVLSLSYQSGACF